MPMSMTRVTKSFHLCYVLFFCVQQIDYLISQYATAKKKVIYDLNRE